LSPSLVRLSTSHCRVWKNSKNPHLRVIQSLLNT
jgi:hypothetical protein